MENHVVQSPPAAGGARPAQRNTQQNIEKVEALLLNKVEGLKWCYHELNLNALISNKDHSLDTSTPYQKFLDDIYFDGNSYSFIGESHHYSDVETQALHGLLAYIKQHPSVLRKVTKRLFDINDTNGGIINQSRAHLDLLGKLNLRDRERRNSFFMKRMREGRRNQDHVVVIAEGDSWFQFPKFTNRFDAVKDIIDWLVEDENISVYSLASGGDWLSNILYTGEYVEELPKLSPDVFLISGGGNDLVGGHRLATMVRNPYTPNTQHRDEAFVQALVSKRKKQSAYIDIEMYERGLRLLSDEFFQFLNLCMVQYFVFFTNIKQTKKYDDMLILTQGYDFAIPAKRSAGRWLSKQRIVNRLNGIGQHLYEPLSMKGIIRPEDQRAVVYAMIYEFNEMLIQLAEYKEFSNVFHIDCRGVAKEDDWFDELHLKSAGYKIITRVYQQCIQENLRKSKQGERGKVYRVADNIA